jgi:hypothetical protein
MEEFKYTPDADLEIHPEGAIRLICRAYQSHENGLPEWTKNASDAYARENAPEAKRVIVIIFNFGRGRTPSISCLDFSGMTSEMIQRNFRVWADPTASGAISVASVQGGHGNGGKCYMTQMFEDYSLIHTVKGGKGNRYGVIGGSVSFGYIPDTKRGRDFRVDFIPRELEVALRSIGCSVDLLPDGAGEALRLADGFTLVTGMTPKHYGNRIPARRLLETLQEHPQMIRTLELCKVFAMANGRTLNGGRELRLTDIEPLEGAEKPRVLEIPRKLIDPVSDQEISTTDEEALPPGSVTLRTSKVSMRWGKKGRHKINYQTKSGYIGYVLVTELDIQSIYRDRIYGECYLESLEPYKQNERARLADNPLTRAVETFIADQIQAYATEFEAKEKRKYRQEEKNELSRINEALDRWKNRFLAEFMRGLWGGDDGLTKERAVRTPLPTGRPARLELTLTHGMAGLGVAFRPRVRFFDHLGQEIRAVPFRWVSEDNNVAMVDENLAIINTFAFGETAVHAETLDGKIRSTPVPLRVVHIHQINIEPSQVEIAVGSRQMLKGVCQLANGEMTSDVYLEWMADDSNIAGVSSSGLIFGLQPGTTKIAAGDDRCDANPIDVKVVLGQGGGTGRHRGQGYPTVKLSEVDPHPITGEIITFAREEPPVIQRAQDVEFNIWWINSAAPLARMYLDGGLGYGYKSREWRMYHLERYIDIMAQIALTRSPEEHEDLSINEWIIKWGERVAEIQQSAASDLREFIASGELPTE